MKDLNHISYILLPFRYIITVFSILIATVSITHAELIPFAQRYTINLKGNLKVIGNTVLQSPTPNSTRSNADLNLSYVDIDGVGSTFNSSSATINNTEAGVDVTGARIKWAGLYWQGYLHNDINDTGIDTVYNFSTSQSTANTQIPNTINTQSVLLKVGSNPYISIPAQKIGMDRQYNRTNYVSYKYAAFANVTSLLKNLSPSTKYTVANIPIRSGQTTSGNVYDGLGNYGAWALVVVYDNNTSISEKTRNITVFDGYTVLSAANNPTQTINLSGFKTPSIAPNGVDSTLSVFAGEGDRNILGDFATLTNEDGYTYNLPDNSGAGSYFASYIEGVPTRNPIIINNNGIDIHTTQVGTSGGNNRPIKENQTTASVTLGTTQDTFMPSMIAFATELFTPKLCYDYDVRIGDFIKISSDNREIHASSWGSSPLSLTMLIRSEISDFPLTDSRLNVTFTPNKLNYVHGSSQVSPPDSNSYSSIGDIDAALGQIGIGRDANADMGGTIGALESTYAKQQFKFLGSRFDGTFDMHVEGKIQFDPNFDPVPFSMSTDVPSDSPNYIGRCSINPVYNPIWASFNIERPDSNQGPNANSAAYKYPLYTQIVGKDFNISVVSYKINPATGKYELPLDTNATVELEIIDASVFDNNASAGYDSTCEEPRSIGSGAFINFAPNGTPQSRINVKIPQDIPNFNNDTALQNAAFRLWVLTTRDINGTKHIITHNCTLDDKDTCFKNLYEDTIAAYDTDGKCTTSCKTSYATKACYTCLREHFASPICSRDNFAIRPESFRIKIGDSNETNNSQINSLTDNSSNYDPAITLAAGYKYAIDINATRYNTDTNAKAYYNESFKAATNLTALGDKTKNNTIVALEFADSSACSDTTHRSYDLKIQNGKLDANTYVSQDNVGQYNMWMLDANWTNVDQAIYPFKVNFGSCVTGSTDPLCTDCDIINPSNSERNSNGKLGCVINSNITSNNAIKDNNYREIPLRFEPYAFDLNEVNLTVLPDNNASYIFMNDFGNSYYKDQLLNPLSQSMSSSYIGNLSAVSKSGTVTSNFTNGCAAEDVILHIDKTTSPTENAIHDSDGHLVPFQQFLQHTSTTSNIASSASAIDANTTLPKVAFSDTINPGSAYMLLHTNFKKPVNTTVNPIDVNYTGLYAYSPNAQSSAQMVNDYVPDGNKSSNRNVLYYFAKVTPFKTLYDNVKTSSIDTPLFVDIYCDLVAPLSCSDFNLNNLSKGQDQEAGWYSANMFDKDHDGTTDLSVKTIFGDDANPSVSPNNDVQFDDENGTQNDINVSLAGPARPSTVEVEVRPVPWLLFDPKDPNGYPHYRIKFIGDSAWSGVGNVGNAVEATSNENPGLPRLSW